MGKTHIFTAWKTPADILSEIAPEIGAVVNSRQLCADQHLGGYGNLYLDANLFCLTI